MTFHTYMLHCADGSYYVGHTDNLEQRIAQHQSGEISGYTQTRRPVALVWSQDFGTRDEALSAEQQIKGWSRKKKEGLIAGDWDAIRQAARKSFDTGLRQAQPLLRTNGIEMTAFPPPPVIVLVRPQLGENIGKAARAMLNFGLTEMRLVAPRDGWPNPDAGPSAAGADFILDQAQVFETLADAVSDCAHVYATTVRKRGVTKPVVTPEEAAREIHAAQGRCAYIFGPERSGLETEDVALARKILTVPINPEFGSLNLAQAVILCAYEWSKQANLSQPTVTDLGEPAPQVELEGMIEQLNTLLEKVGYFFPPDRAPATKLTLRNLLTKPGWNHLEVRTLRGVLSHLNRPRER
ncbi:MAG: TrmJ/YjtD family RNA methyltransferase [Pseudomonadota bacterium]|uniref:tRNA (cytidine/uridine-2'-O-)-methyltransferase TrmJ n=1 Tax=Sphingobium xenophagum TaxID=121428 RepID=A0A249MVY1_SPHXE|nr:MULTISPECIES: TrmJ/YjtD family RNA methyltransferase [Sphingobium]ASY45523.1 rRNA methyltransferase [Sphingobium xenophagum]OUC54957.1 rRNA methyltransferase [Sphingobium sp. GW456-12-10-14-TSB1]QWT13884.1 TrmJ/YjtD family RNA methyltransferase [Sphingobium xenophagum]|tara:strand:+ start:709 stop:1764 length:1056 start_codon:yes stop_codon:yes gene_type:complete